MVEEVGDEVKNLKPGDWVIPNVFGWGMPYNHYYILHRTTGRELDKLKFCVILYRNLANTICMRGI